MAVPKKRQSKTRTSRRRANHDRARAPNTGECANCSEPKLPHRVCRACGYYRGVQVVVGADADDVRDHDVTRDGEVPDRFVVQVTADVVGGEDSHHPALFVDHREVVLVGFRQRMHDFVERHPLDDINRIFEAVHDHELQRRAILEPA